MENGGNCCPISWGKLAFQISRVDQISMSVLRSSFSASQRKLCVRLLPSSMKVDAFIQMLRDDGFEYNRDYQLLYYVQGNQL